MTKARRQVRINYITVNDRFIDTVYRQIEDILKWENAHQHFIRKAFDYHGMREGEGEIMFLADCVVAQSFLQSSSMVEVSPNGNPSSLALSNRRMIFPLLVLGSVGRNSISRGEAALESLFLTNFWISCFNSSDSS